MQRFGPSPSPNVYVFICIWCIKSFLPKVCSWSYNIDGIGIVWQVNVHLYTFHVNLLLCTVHCTVQYSARYSVPIKNKIRFEQLTFRQILLIPLFNKNYKFLYFKSFKQFWIKFERFNKWPGFLFVGKFSLTVYNMQCIIMI